MPSSESSLSTEASPAGSEEVVLASRWPLKWWLRAFVLAIALPLLALLLWIFTAQVGQERAQARQSALAAARVTAYRLRDLHVQSLTLIETVGRRLSAEMIDASRCDPEFGVVDYFPEFADLVLFSPSGSRICATDPGEADRALAMEAEAWVSGEIRSGRFHARRPMIRVIDGRWVSAVGLAVISPRGANLGILTLVQYPDLIGRDALPGSVVTITDGKGIILARTADAAHWVGRSARGIGVTDLSLRLKQGSGEGLGLDGVPRQYGFTYVPEMGWHVNVGVPTSQVMRSVRLTIVRGSLGAIVIIILIGGVALFFSDAISRPVNAVAAAAAGVARGEYQRVNVSEGPREMIVLASAFNDMVAARSQAEQHMVTSEANLKALSERLLLIQEQERTRIAREIHDDLGQSLTALKMDVIGLLGMIDESAVPARIRERILGTLDSTTGAVQRISYELRPSTLDDLGLSESIENEGRLFEERTGIEVELSLGDGNDELPPAVTSTVYRIFQEAMTNVARHSNATRVEVRLRSRGAEFWLEVRDDGRGATVEEIDDPSSLGLISIRERAALIGGSVRFEGVEGFGTIVSVCIPLDRGEGRPQA